MADGAAVASPTTGAQDSEAAALEQDMQDAHRKVEEIRASQVSEQQTAPAESSVSTTSSEPEVMWGLTARHLIGGGALAVGGTLTIAGIITVATRDDAKTEYDVETNTVTVTKKQSAAVGWTLFGVGLTVAAAGAFALWVEPALDLGLFANLGVAPTPGGGALVWSGSF